MTTFPNVQNDSYKSVHNINYPSRLVTGKHRREVPLRSDDNALEAVANCSFRSVIPKIRKRFKPESALPEFNAYTSSKLQTQTNTQDSINQIQYTTSTLDEGESSQGNGNCGTSEDEGVEHYERYKCCGREEGVCFDASEYKGATSLKTISLGMKMGIEKRDVPTKVSAKLEMHAAAFDFDFLELLMSTQGYSLLKKKTDGLVLKCPEDHNVHIKYKDKLKVLECKKCNKRLVKCIQFARLNNGKVVNKSFSPVITYECERGHQWECKYGKAAFSHWCPQCEKLIQEERKKVLEREAEKAREESIREQNAILEEARLRMQQDQPRNYQALFYQWDIPLENKGLTDASVNQLSKELAEKYLKDNGCSLFVSFEDIFLVFKILITSKEMLIAKLKIVPAQELCSFYRKCAAKLHPDKNKHPRASEAFQKLAECYKQCLS